jgi:hypothetical protein
MSSLQVRTERSKYENQKPDQYAYQPIAYFNGKVLKCAGIITADNEHIIREKASKEQNGLLTGYIVLDDYYGDRIHADTHKRYTDGDKI